MGVPLFETKAAKYLKNVRGTICDSQVVENPETDRPNPAQVMHEVQPSRLLPIQISTFDYLEQAVTNIRAYTLTGHSLQRYLIFPIYSPNPGPITTVHNRLVPRVSGFSAGDLLSWPNPKTMNYATRR